MTKSDFPEKITPFLRAKLRGLESRYGKESSAYRGLALQYLSSDLESAEMQEQNLKHYEAGVEVQTEHGLLPGIERLYGKVMVIEPTLVCLAHCRYCLRGNYAKHTLTERQLVDAARYCGSEANRSVLNEVLITGGDPLIIPQRIEALLEALIEFAPNIKIVRIGTRVPAHDPVRIDENVERLFKNKPSLRFELATQINHPIEFFPEVEEAYRKIRSMGVRIYAQNIILRGINDRSDTLVDLYNKMRLNGIEAHYLFHCVPMQGSHHLRTSLARSTELVKDLVCSGSVSGRVKPIFAAMTDIGKISFFEGVIRERDGDWVQLQSNYRLADRLAWNPSWQLPPKASVDERGYLRVWYLDGKDES